MKDNVVQAKTKYARTSVKKVYPVLDLVRNKDVVEVENILKFNSTKAAEIVLKTLHSAIANAKNNLSLQKEELVLNTAFVDKGPTLRNRGRIVARGRYSPLLKRTSHIVLGLAVKDKN